MKLLRLSAICLIFCVASSIFTFCLTNTFLTEKQSQSTDKKEKTKDLYSSSLTLSQLFKKCNHTQTYPSGTVTYSSTEELLNRFNGYEITSGEGEELVLCTEIDNYCNFHYRATLKDSDITILRLSDNEKITAFKITPQSLSKEEKSLLEQGITLDSQKALSSFIEDFTS